ncbi:MAG: glucose-6-phosphate dehydrogenase [Chitinophagaceae bacterium]|nr:glucose-6-phosphate dehydrogenase [Oligoflexus sp.]
MNTPKPTILVIFGAGGDLTHRKLIPALFNLSLDGRLPEHFSVIGLDHKPFDESSFRSHLQNGVNEFSRRGKVSEETWDKFSQNVSFTSLDFTTPQSYYDLANTMRSQSQAWDVEADQIFYLAVAPTLIELIVTALNEAKLLSNPEKSRVVVEKPFGRDLASACQLNRTLTRVMNESQIFRIDHYLGKETVQNILAIRFANSLFEPIWNRRYIDNVQITVAERVGIEHRRHYYDSAGALRDMMENHLFQLLGLIAMEAPVSFDQDEIRNKKVDVLNAIRLIDKDHVGDFAIRGQYGPENSGASMISGYRAEPNVNSDSNTETYAALKLHIDNWRWQDVPFYLRTGKRLADRIAEISLQFRPVPHRAFPDSATKVWAPNHLQIRVQKNEGISLHFQAKKPGTAFTLQPAAMKFSYGESFTQETPEAYETLLIDVMNNDATSFVRADLETVAWSVVSPILEVWQNEEPNDFPNYTAGSWGPKAADAMVERDGRAWLLDAESTKEGDDA